jgi:hypothetical protein
MNLRTLAHEKRLLLSLPKDAAERLGVVEFAYEQSNYYEFIGIRMESAKARWVFMGGGACLAEAFDDLDSKIMEWYSQQLPYNDRRYREIYAHRNH